LKVACTGELPPNARSGHSFIHDPKVTLTFLSLFF
jgi:DNA repair protein RAD50